MKLLVSMTRTVVSVLACATAMWIPSAHAEFPDRAIMLVVPFAAGTSPDTLSRLLGDQLSKTLGKPVVVNNKVGASGIIGTQTVATAAPDGYTLGYANVSTLSVNQSLFKKLPYDVDKQLTPIAMVGKVNNVLVVRKGLPVNSVAELIQYAKKNPGKLTAASAGIGSTGHLSAELFNRAVGISVVHVPYKGGADAAQAVLRGEADMLFDNVLSMEPHILAGTVHALAVTGATRERNLPNIPTVAEAGVKNFQTSAWVGIVGPAGMDTHTVKTLNERINAILKSPEMKERLAKLAFEPTVAPPEYLFDYARQERQKWATVVRAANITLD